MVGSILRHVSPNVCGVLIAVFLNRVWCAIFTFKVFLFCTSSINVGFQLWCCITTKTRLGCIHSNFKPLRSSQATYGQHASRARLAMAGNKVLFEATFRQARADEYVPWFKRCSGLFLFLCRLSELCCPLCRNVTLDSDRPMVWHWFFCLFRVDALVWACCHTYSIV